MKKILVTGANGQLGKELRDLASSFLQYEFLFLSREDLPIHQFELVRNVFASFLPDFCINCAAYTAVDKAEQEAELAQLVNGESVGILAAVSAAHGCRFIHVSTDYVYGGDASEPYAEDSPTAPSSVYGKTKLAGEVEAIKNDPLSVIIRTSWVYSHYGNNFVKTMLRLGGTRDSLTVVADQIGGPTPAADIADALLVAAKAMVDGAHGGTHHFGGAPDVSWAGFARAIMAQAGLACQITDISTSAYPTPAARPLNSRLDCSAFEAEFGVKRPDWRLGLAAILQELSA